MIRATGYFVLIELEEVEQKIKEGSLEGFVTTSNIEHEREQRGHHKGTVVDIGPLAFAGYSGINNDLSSIKRADQWGIKIGDTIECGRYAGEMVQKEGIDRFMLIPDAKIMGAYDAE